MFAEIGPQDAIEAMLVAQITATHVTMTNLKARMSYQRDYQVREAYERSMTRIGARSWRRWMRLRNTEPRLNKLSVSSV